jgi:hypothetical protein
VPVAKVGAYEVLVPAAMDVEMKLSQVAEIAAQSLIRLRSAPRTHPDEHS